MQIFRIYNKYRNTSNMVFLPYIYGMLIVRCEFTNS